MEFPWMKIEAKDFLVDLVKLPPRLKAVRRFSGVAGVVAVLGIYAVLRPGRGADLQPVLSAGRTEARPVFIDVFSNT